ncbi:type I DNA topoisomerase [candidate division WWE3 bacterium]|nr:type I DNA topoisomerase [candidate division WWE3 bacterium]
MKLVIVESPTKAKTLKSILGKSYKILASFGHIRDLPKKELGVDVANDFNPVYEIPAKASKTINELKKEAQTASAVILATDPDREGEAIAWHLKEILTGNADLKKKSLKVTKKKTKLSKKKTKEVALKEGEVVVEVPLKVKGLSDDKFSRIVFHEITKDAIDEAFLHPGIVNKDLVDAQQARRILDRLVGYNLSPLLWKKVRYGLSAGRVQSVAVRLVVEKERERKAFKSEEYWSIDGIFETPEKDVFMASLTKLNGKKVLITNEKDTKSLVNLLLADKFVVENVTKSERKRKPYPPLRTSTLQQAASNIYSFTAKRTMSAAQKLFEEGLITYHRTDSLNLAPGFIEEARKFINTKLGKKFIPTHSITYKTNAKSAQEAHEAIRPTNVSLQIDEIEAKGLTKDEVKVYSLILKRTLESQMTDAVYDQTSVKILSQGGYEFSVTGSIVKFEGWLALGTLVGLEEDTKLELSKLLPEQHFTQPPARYSDATLIKQLEEIGVGRPSTYAPTLTTIQNRQYVLKDGKYFVPEEVAYVVNDLLVAYFPEVIDFQFTANMEEKFDEIASGALAWVPVLKEFYSPFEKDVAKADKELEKKDVTNLGESDEKCPKCGKVLLFKLGKYGKFLSCSGFPECEFAKPLDSEGVNADGEATTFGKCDKCEEGQLVLKQGRFGKFLACNKYPDCKNTKPFLQKVGMSCPKCKESQREGGEVVVKKAKGRVFYGCSNYPNCDYASWKNPMQGNSGDDE